jgi:hypothetical protein
VKCLAIDETPIFIEKSIHELQIELDTKIPDFENSAYFQSQLTVKGRIFVNSNEFRLRFLRFELFDIQKSAIRMLKWLEISYSLFGSVALERPVRLSTDFSSHEQKLFRKGYVQVLPIRATGTGRRIMCAIPYDEDYYKASSKQTILKILLYTCWVLGNDIDTQRKGIVVVVMFDSSFHQIPSINGAGIMRPSDQWVMSVRTSAIHICSPDTPFFRLRRRFLTMVVGSLIRSRLQLHLGTSIELRYIIQVYGIPVEFIPITHTGKIKLTYIRQWLRIRYMIEDQEKLIATDYNIKNIIVEAPYLNDVLFKQGDSFTRHPGNDMLRNLIECKVKQLYDNNDNKTQLQAVTKELKKALVSEIMDEIEHAHGGRFLYWHQSNNMSDCWWVLLHTNGNINDQKAISTKIEFLLRKLYNKEQHLRQAIRRKYMNKQQELILHQNNMFTDTQNNNNNNEKKTKIIECNNNDTRSLIIIDPPSTTINQNGGTFLFHSLDGRHNNTQGLLSLHHHDSGNDSDDSINIAMKTAVSSSSSCIPSSECFGMKFVPCSD